MNEHSDNMVISLLSEIFTVDQLARTKLGKVLPKGMELSHFSVLNHLAHVHAERSPAELASVFNVTRGAMTNTLRKLEDAGYVHIRPDWDDARRKFVAISPAGNRAREAAIAAVAPLLRDLADQVGTDHLRMTLPVLREMRRLLGPDD